MEGIRVFDRNYSKVWGRDVGHDFLVAHGTARWVFGTCTSLVDSKVEIEADKK
jgi:hypothetical protein